MSSIRRRLQLPDGKADDIVDIIFDVLNYFGVGTGDGEQIDVLVHSIHLFLTIIPSEKL